MPSPGFYLTPYHRIRLAYAHTIIVSVHSPSADLQFKVVQKFQRSLQPTSIETNAKTICGSKYNYFLHTSLLSFSEFITNFQSHSGYRFSYLVVDLFSFWFIFKRDITIVLQSVQLLTARIEMKGVFHKLSRFS